MVKVHLFLSIILFDSPIRSLLDSRWLDFICFEYYNNKIEISMSLGQKTLILLATITIIVVAHPHASATCPNPPSYTTLHHGHFSVQVGGIVSLQNGVDSLCYNYTLPAPFQNRPGVAIAVRSLQATQSQDLFFSIRSSKSDSLSILSFLVRTQWKYTTWSLIAVNFFAQDFQGYEANTFSIDTTALAGCTANKEVLVMLPYRSNPFSPAGTVAFLHGFDMTTQSSDNNYRSSSPYEIQMLNIIATALGVSLKLTVTTNTKVFNVFISYIAWDINTKYTVGGSYEYNTYSPRSSLTTSVSNVQANMIDVSGITGFIISNGPFLINTTFTNSRQFNFYTFTNFTYLSYSYFFLNYPPCSDCSGNRYLFNGSCYASCPAPSYQVNGSCLTCPQGQIFNGTACINSMPQCPTGQTWNGTNCIITASIICPNGLSWNGSICMSAIQCPGNLVWNGFYCTTSSSLQCPSGTTWNGTLCLTNSVKCPQGTYWNGSNCISNITCSGGQFFNGTACTCPNNQYFNGISCVSCGNSQMWYANSLVCSCPNGQHYNGYSCITCPSGQFWSSQTNACTCPIGQNWNGFSCLTCDGSRSWNQLINGCQCPSNLNWNGIQCISCAFNQYWNGYVCITCSNGQIWNNISLICDCETNSQWNGTQCIQTCPPGKISVAGNCECSAGLSLINGVCQTTPKCASGTTWNGSSCESISCPTGYYWNGMYCTIQTQSCPAGTYWGGLNCISITNQCPPATTWNGVMCQSNGTTCAFGTFWNGASCQSLSSRCPSGLNWVNGACTASDSQCPPGTYFNSQTCFPISPCTGSKIWSQNLLQCICPDGTFFNGLKCINCGGDQIYDSAYGCICPSGLFWDGKTCIPLTVTACKTIQNSEWSNSKCQCLQGYIQKAQSCICNGLALNGICDQCYLKPNSVWKFSQCQCLQGYFEYKGTCKKITVSPNNQTNSNNRPNCNVGTYYDTQQNECLPCSDGCLSCTGSYTCLQCRPEYIYSPTTQLCTQICGDAKRFTLQCDDGNNNNYDGCSTDCMVEPGYQCTGGSPNSKDTCTLFKPNALVISQSGQSHIRNKIILNARLNYLPQQLIRSPTDCKNSCQSILQVSITKGDKSSLSIVSKYIPTSSFSFSVQINFGREPIGLFTVRIGLQQGIALKYYGGIDTSNALEVDINPAFLSLYRGGEEDYLF